MARILHAITDTATSEIESGGFMLRIRRIRSSDMAEVGVAALQLVPQATKEADADTTAETVSQQVSPQQMRKLTEHQEAVVCAALVALGDPESGEWDPCQIVLDAKRQDPTKGRIWIGSLPPAMVTDAFNEAMRLTSDNEVAASRLAAFRTGARSSSAG